MYHIRHNITTFEIILGILGAFGMMSMILNPVLGKIMMGIALSLLFILYLLFGMSPRDPDIDSRFQLVLNRINFMTSSIASVILFIMLIFLPGNLALALSALGLSIICMTLNASHRYLYCICDEDYFHQQLRLLVMVILVIVVMASG
jgi:hypothetical protein